MIVLVAMPPLDTAWLPPELMIEATALPFTFWVPPSLIVVLLTVLLADTVDAQVEPPGRIWLSQVAAYAFAPAIGNITASTAAGLSAERLDEGRETDAPAYGRRVSTARDERWVKLVS
jgi:hypothetical protein